MSQTAKLDFDAMTLNYCIGLCFRTEAENLNSDFKLVEEYFNLAEEPHDGNLIVYYDFLKKMLEVRDMSKHFDIETLFIHLREDPELEELFTLYEEQMGGTTEDTRQSIRIFLQRKIQFVEVVQGLDTISTLKDIIRLDDGSMDNFAFQETMNSLNKEIKKVEKSLKRNNDRNKHEKTDFKFGHSTGLNVLFKVRENNLRPNSRLRTSVQYMNKMLNGGYNGGRCYIYFALPGIGKSFQLLNSAIDIALYNSDIKTKNPLLKPCVLYLTQENSQEETMERSFNRFYTKKIEEFETAELIKAFEDMPLSKSNIHLDCKYRPNLSIDCNDIRTMIDELAYDGYEVVAVIHDYLKRIRSIESGISKENTFLELGNITNEFKDLAIEYNIPVILASQLNRDAFSKIEAAIANNKADIGKNIGISQVGESVRIIENVDYAMGLSKEYDSKEGIEYLTFKLLKKREKQKATDITYFAHPFHKTLHKLEEDSMLPESLSKLSLTELFKGSDGGSAEVGGRPTLTQRAISGRAPIVLDPNKTDTEV